MIKILFVCLGNICRSPMAQAVFEHKVKEKGLQDKLKADSAGTSAYHIGSQPDPRTIKTLQEKNIIFSHAARQAKKIDAESFNYIVAMDKSNFNDLKNILPKDYNGLLLMRDFDQDNKGANVPDPYYGGDDGFEEVYEILDRSIDVFLDKIIKEHSLG